MEKPEKVKQALNRFKELIYSLECECDPYNGFTCSIHKDRELADQACDLWEAYHEQEKKKWREGLPSEEEIVNTIKSVVEPTNDKLGLEIRRFIREQANIYIRDIAKALSKRLGRIG